jgi:hypothetical protein
MNAGSGVAARADVRFVADAPSAVERGFRRVIRRGSRAYLAPAAQHAVAAK